MQVLIADDHCLFRGGCKLMLKELDPKVQVFEAGDFDEVQEVLRSNNNLDLILLDLKMPGMDSLEGVRRSRELAPATPLVVVSAFDDPYYAQQVMDSGAAGYIPKSAKNTVILSALKLILEGGNYVPPALMSAKTTHSHHNGDVASALNDVLTPRQRDVMSHLSRGESNKGIADKLGLSEGTVKVHVAAILKALNASNRTHAVLMASGLVNE